MKRVSEGSILLMLYLFSSSSLPAQWCLCRKHSGSIMTECIVVLHLFATLKILHCRRGGLKKMLSLGLNQELGLLTDIESI